MDVSSGLNIPIAILYCAAIELANRVWSYLESIRSGCMHASRGQNRNDAVASLYSILRIPRIRCIQ